MIITAKEMREKVNAFNEEIKAKEIKIANDYLDRIVEPAIKDRAKRGFTFIDLEIPLTVDHLKVKDFLTEKGFVVKGSGFNKTIEW